MRQEIAEARFWAKVTPTGFCWEWGGEVNSNGYGRGSYHGKNHLAHRVAWTLLMGEIPAGLVIDHLCRNRLCVNPDHLEPVTHKENLARAKRLRNIEGTYTRVRPQRRDRDSSAGNLQSCRHGHKLTPDNTLLARRADGKIRTRCMTCQHAAQERLRRKEGATLQGLRGSYGPRNKELFKEFWGFSYEEWLSKPKFRGWAAA